MTWSKDGPLGNESGKIKWEIVRYTRGRGLDVGCGIHKTFPHFIGVDNRKDQLLFNQAINPDVVVSTAAELPMFANGSMDFVFSSHLLEHFPLEKHDPKRYPDLLQRRLAEKMMVEKHSAVEALREWMRVIKHQGYLVLYVPDEDEYPKVGEEGANPDHCCNLNYDTVVELMRKTGAGWDLIDFQKRNAGIEYSLYFVFQKTGGKTHFSWQAAKTDVKRCGLVRYGAFGDLLQCSSVAAGLKKQGYEVTLFTSPPAHDIILTDPNIADFYLQDKDQVPNHLLGEFWDYHRAKYDKWVNLSESVEGSFLAMPGRTPHGWTPLARHALMNRNYLEMQHAIADVPHEPAVHFFPTDAERTWAERERRRLDGNPLVLWALSGSSCHKTWSGLDPTIASILLDFPAARIVLVGGDDCRLLEQGWEHEPRVVCRSGEWSIRQTLTFAQGVDLAIGPETGVMNGISAEPMAKVVLLSHSTVENLTRDWVNTYSAWSDNTHCPGRGQNVTAACHQMHFDWKHCRQTDDGTAQCQRDINGAAVYGRIREFLTAVTRRVLVA